MVKISSINASLSEVDPEIYEAIKKEVERQNTRLQLIASENHVSQAVMEATASVMTNKYAEGYPRKRYYGGCDFVDVAEELAIERAKKLFSAEHANVQAHSGSQANMAVYYAAAEPGDTILGMDLCAGGHLTHGSPYSFSGSWFKAVHYGVSKEDECIDYDQVLALAKEHKPKIIVCGASAYPRTIDFKHFREIADEVDAYLMADIAHIAGLVAAGQHPSPVPHVDFVTTTTHKTLRGPRGALILCKEEHAKKLDKAVFPGIQGGPFMNVIAAKAVCFQEALTQEWRDYQEQIVANASTLASELKNRGHRLVSGGTDNHLMLVDVYEKGITGKEAETALANSRITLNKNTIPFDTQKPFIASGIRIGTPCVTTRGMKEPEMKEVGGLISTVLANISDEGVQKEVAAKVKELCGRFPLYPEP